MIHWDTVREQKVGRVNFASPLLLKVSCYLKAEAVGKSLRHKESVRENDQNLPNEAKTRD